MNRVTSARATKSLKISGSWFRCIKKTSTRDPFVEAINMASIKPPASPNTKDEVRTVRSVRKINKAKTITGVR